MGSGKNRRGTWAAGLSLLLHVLALAGLVVGVKVLTPPPDDRAMELRLIPAPAPRPPPKPVRRPPQRVNTAAQPPPAQPSPPAPPVVLPEPPSPGVEAVAKGLLPSLSGRLGCDGPLAVHMTAEQRQVCADSLARRMASAPDVSPIDPAKRRGFDMSVRARDERLKASKGTIPKDDWVPCEHADNLGLYCLGH